MEQKFLNDLVALIRAAQADGVSQAAVYAAMTEATTQVYFSAASGAVQGDKP